MKPAAKKVLYAAFIFGTLLVVLLLLVVAALVALRLLGWSGQRVEGTLTALVNPWNPVDMAGYRPTLTEVEGRQVDQSCAQPLANLLGACRAAGLLAKAHGCVERERKDLADFLQERWKGNFPIGWGDTLREAEYTQWIYKHVLGL